MDGDGGFMTRASRSRSGGLAVWRSGDQGLLALWSKAVSQGGLDPGWFDFSREHH